MLIDTNVISSAAMKNIRLRPLAAAGSSSMKMTASIVPTNMKGVLLPLLWFILSDHAPKMGSIINAKILSSAIIAPEAVSPISKKYLSMSGIILS